MALRLGRDFLKQSSRALVRLLAAFEKHGTAVLVDYLDIETLLRLLEHDVLSTLRRFPATCCDIHTRTPLTHATCRLIGTAPKATLDWRC